MSNRIPREKRKYLLKDSDRSGFTYFKNELVRQEGKWVHPSEYDEPPPHSKYIGGADINRGEARSKADRESYPTAKTEIWSP